MKKQIRQEGMEHYQDHRADFETCPSCGHSMTHAQWKRAAHTLCLRPACQKSGNVSVVSECPKCFENTWVHEPMGCFSYGGWPKKWSEAVERESERVKLQALRDWAASLCGRCAKLTGGKVEYSTYCYCDGRMGPAELEECDRFEELPKRKAKS